MNLSETARLLSMIAAFNNRTIGEADVMAWQSVLSDVNLPDAEEAVRRHYAEHTEWLMPAHVRRIVRDILQERFVMAQSTGWAPGQAGVPKGQAMPEVSTGERLALSDLPAAVAALVARVRADLPEGSREALMPRRVAWEREHQAFVKMRDATPNPLYKPNPHKAPLADDSGAYFPAVPQDVGPDRCPGCGEVLTSHGFHVSTGRTTCNGPNAELCPGGESARPDEDHGGVLRHDDGTFCGHGRSASA